ncbi:MAG: amidase [Isosphaeraceae bacterium]
MSSLLGDLPRLFPRPEQTITGIGRLLRRREVSCVDILNACLEQVDAWEPKVHAWVVLDRDGAMTQARVLDEELRSGNDRGPLHGIPMGIKDIIDVLGLPTACGAKRWVNRIARKDADVVARLRSAGAVIMGKTVTTAYAWIDPPPTRNPWNLDRTPGGSSSGSAAAVACGMCYGAIGTQTGGSITRPASFCGVAGMKPAHTQVSTNGVLPFSPSLDHVGPISRCSSDLKLLFPVVWRVEGKLRTELLKEPSIDRPVRLGRLRGFFDRRLEEPCRSLLDEAQRLLAVHGAEVIDIDDPVDFEGILVQHRTIMAAEAAETHNEWFDEAPEDYPPHIRALVEEGRPILALPYIRARSGRDAAWKALVPILAGSGLDGFVTPATVGTAPDLSTTGNPAFNSPWSYTGLPTVSFPVGLAGDGMPLSLQLVGYGLRDYNLLHTAEWCETAIKDSQSP